MRANPILLALLLSGCGATQYVAITPPAFDLGCDRACFEKCPTVAPLPVAADGTSDIDDGDTRLIESASALATCDSRRALCAQCITRGCTEGVLKCPEGSTP